MYNIKRLLILSWTSATLAFLAMIVGHFDAQSLSWNANQISTYAAKAPYDYFVTTSMTLHAITLLTVGLLISHARVLGDSILTTLITALSGAAAAGLIMLAYYEETASSLSALKNSGFWAIRVQSFHDAGLEIFFYSSIILIFILGVVTCTYQTNVFGKIGGIVISVFSPISYLLMTTDWTTIFRNFDATIGIKQRAGLLALWIAITVFLFVVSKSHDKSRLRD